MTLAKDAELTTSKRIVVAVGVAVWGVFWLLRDIIVERSPITDFDQVWYAARAVMDGVSPYTVIGPGRPFPLEYDFYYPLPAALIAVPLGMLPLLAARITFVAVSSALFAWTFLGAGWFRWPVFLSASFLISAAAAQWTPLLLAATLWAPLAWVLIAKPNVALAMAPAGSARQRLIALVGGASILALSFIVDPNWITEWLAALGRGEHFLPLILHVTTGGPLLALAMLKWRRWEAWLLLAFAVIPHSVTIYETLALYLIARSRQETLALAVCSAVAFFWQGTIDNTTWTAYLKQLADIVLITMYLPALVLVLKLPNEGDVPAFLERGVDRWPAWLRGRAGSSQPSAPGSRSPAA